LKFSTCLDCYVLGPFIGDFYWSQTPSSSRFHSPLRHLGARSSNRWTNTLPVTSSSSSEFPFPSIPSRQYALTSFSPDVIRRALLSSGPNPFVSFTYPFHFLPSGKTFSPHPSPLYLSALSRAWWTLSGPPITHHLPIFLFLSFYFFFPPYFRQ